MKADQSGRAVKFCIYHILIKQPDLFLISSSLFSKSKSHSTARRGAVRLPPVCWLFLACSAVSEAMIIKISEPARQNVPTCESWSAHFYL